MIIGFVRQLVPSCKEVLENRYAYLILSYRILLLELLLAWLKLNTGVMKRHAADTRGKVLRHKPAIIELLIQP
jgi:hypothetical protein